MALDLGCAVCRRPAPSDPMAWRCACGGPWALEPVPARLRRETLLTRPPSLWRYREVLPVPDPPVTLGEGMTPLIPARDGTLLYKVESVNPTGSFKDRGAALLLTSLVGSGTREIVEDSSGNAGAAIAAYSARAAIKASIYVPETTSAAKVAQITAYGARAVRVAGTRQDVATAAQVAAPVYASHAWHPVFYHGTKTIAYELWEQLRWRAPDWVVSPVGHGTLLLGLALGFRELLRGGAIARLPRFVAAQTAACAPLAGPPLGLSAPDGPTIAEGIRIRHPVRAAEIAAAVRESDGRWAVVSEAEIHAAWARLGAEGLFVEPTAAVAPAAAWRLVEQGYLDPTDVVVVPLTGHGLKTGSSPPPSSG
ncbi:MAG: pyridoxal-phosphate dependent enzyme [Candidatus Rokuibacteriota bacterium]